LRREFDERVNVELLQNEFGVRAWRFKTRGASIGDKETYYKALGAWNRTGGPTLNQSMSLGNEAFGTDYSPYPGDLANKVPVSVLMSWARDGRLTLDDNGEMALIPPDQMPAPDTTQKFDASDVVKLMSALVSKNDSSASDDAKTLIDVLTRIENRARNYEPPEIDEADYQV